MADVPGVVKYGKVVGHFVSFVADTDDSGNVPDEVPLTGTVTLTPNVPIMKFPTTSPPRTAFLGPIICRLIDGHLTAPNSQTPGVWLTASEQPDGSPSNVQYTATFQLTGVSSGAQPSPIIFEVPPDGEVDLTLIIPETPDPGTVIVVSHEDRLAVEAILASIEDIIDGGGIIQGDDGREVQLRKGATAIEWQYVGDTSWQELVTLAELEGPAGDAGPAGTITSATATGLPAGENPTITLGGTPSARTLAFGIPEGDPGDVLTIGTVTTGAAGSSASASITGTSPDKVLNLTIPRGDVGATGSGVPVGGTTGQFLRKTSATDFATSWGDLDYEGANASYTPTIAMGAGSLVIGNGNIQARYKKVGRRVKVWVTIAFGSTSSISGGGGNIAVTLPSGLPLVDLGQGAMLMPLGQVRCLGGSSNNMAVHGMVVTQASFSMNAVYFLITAGNTAAGGLSAMDTYIASSLFGFSGNSLNASLEYVTSA